MYSINEWMNELFSIKCEQIVQLDLSKIQIFALIANEKGSIVPLGNNLLSEQKRTDFQYSKYRVINWSLQISILYIWRRNFIRAKCDCLLFVHKTVRDLLFKTSISNTEWNCCKQNSIEAETGQIYIAGGTACWTSRNANQKKKIYIWWSFQ